MSSVGRQTVAESGGIRQCGLDRTRAEADTSPPSLRSRWRTSANPEMGEVIPGTKGLRKLRWSLGQKGKRGGSRVIYYYYLPENLILLLAAYAKNRQEDLDAAEKKVLKAAVKQYFEE